jgi:hypothetical protein
MPENADVCWLPAGVGVEGCPVKHDEFWPGFDDHAVELGEVAVIHV